MDSSFSKNRSSWKLQTLIFVFMSAFWVPFLFSAFEYQKFYWFPWLITSRIILCGLPLLFCMIVANKKKPIINFEARYYVLVMMIQASFGFFEGPDKLDFYSWTSLFFFLSSVSYQGSFSTWLKSYGAVSLLTHAAPLFFKIPIYFQSVGAFVDVFTFNVAFVSISAICIYIADNRHRILLENISLHKSLAMEKENRIKIIEEELGQAKKSIIEKSKYQTIADMTAIIAHDLRMPIHLFRQAAEAKDPEDMFDMQERLSISLKRIETLVDGLRNQDIERIISRAWCRLPIESLEQELRTYTEAKGGIFSIDSKVDGDVYVDSNKLGRAVLNLTHNAIDAAKREVSLKIEPIQNKLRIAVVDDGDGIPTGILDKIFNRGYTTKKKGSGLGLWYVRDVIRGHGGDLSYERHQDRTVFSIIIPDSVANNTNQDAGSTNKGLVTPATPSPIKKLETRDFKLQVYLNIKNKESEKAVRSILGQLPLNLSVEIERHDHCQVIFSDCMDIRMASIGKPQISDFSSCTKKLERAMRLRIRAAQQNFGVRDPELLSLCEA